MVSVADQVYELVLREAGGLGKPRLAGLRRLTRSLQRINEYDQLDNDELADRLIQDVWGEMDIDRPEADLLFVAIGRLKDTGAGSDGGNYAVSGEDESSA